MGRSAPSVRRPRAAVVPLLLLALLLLLLALLDGSSLPASATAEPLRVGEPAVPPAGAGGYAFLVRATDGAPVAFDPCRPVHWVVRPDGEPPGGRAVVEAAVARVQRATGLRFVYDGTTQEAPGPGRERRQPARYGDRWAPVLVAWSSAAEVPDLAGPQVGSGVTSWAGGRPAHLVTGQLVLDAADLTDARGRLTPLAAPTVLHELAHVVGLAHVGDPTSLLQPVMGDRTSFGDGDLRGLHALGGAPCS